MEQVLDALPCVLTLENRGVDMYRHEIKEFAEKRGIKSLFHFTRLDNVPSIMRNGLLPRSVAIERGVGPVVNDNQRLDGRPNGSCVSISFPNCKMFYKLRKEFSDQQWAVLKISPQVLWEKDCAFFKHNAADSRVARIPLDDLRTLRAFEGMFLDDAVMSPDDCRWDCDPVDVQAEVMVFDAIEPSYVDLIYVDDYMSMTLRESLAGVSEKFKLVPKNKGVFAYRNDCRLPAMMFA